MFPLILGKDRVSVVKDASNCSLLRMAPLRLKIFSKSRHEMHKAIPDR